MTTAARDAWLSTLSHTLKKNPRLIVQTPVGPSGLLAKERRYVFTYDSNASRPEQEVSLGMAFRLESYQSGDLFGIFSMNEPEGYLRAYLEEAMNRAGIPNKLLWLTLTQGLQIGRVSYRHESLNLEPPPQEDFDQLLSERAGSYFQSLLARYALRSGLSGTQPKVLVPTEAPSIGSATGLPSKASVRTQSLIVKEAGSEFPGLCLNEFFCMSVARRAGLAVPRFWLSEDATRFIISRFDRDEHGNPVGFEDMAVLMGVSAAQKYLGSYESVMRATHTYCQGSEAAKETMFARIAASALLKDGDAHLKNFGLVYQDPGKQVRPSPAYDIVCTGIYPNLDRGLALKMNKSREYPDQEGLLRFGARFSVRKDTALGWIERIEDAITAQLREAAEDPRFVNDPNGTLAKLQEAFGS